MSPFIWSIGLEFYFGKLLSPEGKIKFHKFRSIQLFGYVFLWQVKQ